MADSCNAAVKEKQQKIKLKKAVANDVNKTKTKTKSTGSKPRHLAAGAYAGGG